MPTERLLNNSQTAVAQPCVASSGTLVVADATRLPALSGGDQYHLLVYDPADPANAEVMLVTAASGNVLTVTRAAEPVAGTQAAAYHAAGEVAANSLTVGSLTALISQIAGSLTGSRFAWNETPSGTVDGVNATFTLTNSPTGGSLQLSRNGLLQSAGAGADYVLSGPSVTFNPGAVPSPGDSLNASYTY